MTLETLSSLLAGEPPYRLRQTVRAVFQLGLDPGEATELPAGLRQRLREGARLSFEAAPPRVSADGLARKALLRLADGKLVESVLMSPKPGLWTACVSSQVGCALRCSFCATGLMGFARNLTAEEITDQVLFWRRALRRNPAGRLSNVVYMGMGEPFLNFENVATSLRRLCDPESFGIGARHLSVSTAGIAPGIERFGRMFPQVNLALSLHSAVPEVRSRLVPIHKAYPLHRLARALKEYFRANNRKVFIEYVLLSGENDRPGDARALARFLDGAGPKRLLHVNLIVWNPTATPHAPSSRGSARGFAQALRAAGVSVTFRKNLGADIQGACGQLVVGKRGRA